MRSEISQTFLENARWHAFFCFFCASGILQLIKVLHSNEVQCVNLSFTANSLCAVAKEALPILKLHDCA